MNETPDLQSRQNQCRAELMEVWEEATTLGNSTTVQNYYTALRNVERASSRYTRSLSNTVDFLQLNVRL